MEQFDEGGPRVELRLAYRPPYDWSAIARWLAARAILGVESAGDDAYVREDVVIRHDRDAHSIVVSLPAGDAAKLGDVLARARRTFDVGAEPHIIAAPLRKDPLLRALLRRHPGIRVPGSWDPFELALRAIVGQQVSVAAARNILGRIASTHGLAADRLADVTITGMPRRRAEAIRHLACRVASGEDVLVRQASLDATIERLVALPGIGPWTAHYIAMRALEEPDAFPSGDLILRRNAGNLSARELEKRAEAWRPWRAYAAMLLWTS